MFLFYALEKHHTMPAKISKEVRQRIYELNEESKTVREILGILKSEGIKISDKSIYNILKEKTKNQSLTSFDESFNESFGDNNTTPTLTIDNGKMEKEDVLILPTSTFTNENDMNPQKNINLENLQKEDLYSLINQGVKEGTEQVLSMLNKDISESNDKLDEIIKETKKKTSKPLPVNKLPQINPFNTDGLTEEEKRLRRDMIIKIRNYVDCFSDNEIILSMCGNPVLFKQKLYEKDLASLTVIYEEIQIGINQSKDFEQFMYLFSSTLQITEFVSSILLGMNITGLKDELLNEISEFDLMQLSCELSLSRYISPQKRIMLITLKVLLKKILSNDLLGKHKDLKLKLAGYYNTMTKFLGK